MVSDLLEKQDSVFTRKVPRKYPSSRFAPENWCGLFSGVVVISFTILPVGRVPAKNGGFTIKKSHGISKASKTKHLAAHVDRVIGF